MFLKNAVTVTWLRLKIKYYTIQSKYKTYVIITPIYTRYFQLDFYYYFAFFLKDSNH